MIFLTPSQINIFADQGYIIVDEALTPSEMQGLNQEFESLLTEEAFSKAQIANQLYNEQTRGDWTFWLDQKSPFAFRKIWTELKEWSPFLNETFYCGVTEFEAHLAYYPAGPGYQKHWDQAAGNPCRKISLVLYLNSNWPKNNGGELVLYAPDYKSILEKIAPFGGRLVLFRSDLFPHEVLPSQGARRSLTGWFRSDAL